MESSLCTVLQHIQHQNFIEMGDAESSEYHANILNIQTYLK